MTKVKDKYYNAGILMCGEKILLTKETYLDRTLIKLPGGMQDDIDYNFIKWIENFKELLSKSGFSEKEVEFLSTQEASINRSIQNRSLIRKFLMETGIYPSSFQHVFLKNEPDLTHNNKIIKNFFFVKAYFQSGELKIINSSDISKLNFYYPGEVLDENSDLCIFNKHRFPLEKALDLEIESQKLNLESLSVVNLVWE